MPKTVFNIPTWVCACGYKQDFEPTTEKMDEVFNKDRKFKASNVGANDCPSCILKGASGRLAPANSGHIRVTVMGEEEIDDLVMYGGEVTRKSEAAESEERRPGFREKRNLTTKEKNALKKKIRDDIEFWNQRKIT
jgi:hypothetical protein